MKCSELEINLSLELDGMNDPVDSRELHRHMDGCAKCRARFDAQSAVKSGLGSLARTAVPAVLLTELRTAGRAAAGEMSGGYMFAYDLTSGDGFKSWLMPTFVAAAATVILGLGMITSILSGYENIGSFDVAVNRDGYSSTRVFVPGNSPIERSFQLDSAVREFVLSRASVAKESPTINPKGTLVSLTDTPPSENGSSSEITVVADVFSNGIARISEVLDSSGDAQAVEKLRDALSSDPQFAPFVPSDMDNRSDTMRVVLRIQDVQVNIDQPRTK
jgi:hypothetical protein